MHRNTPNRYQAFFEYLRLLWHRSLGIFAVALAGLSSPSGLKAQSHPQYQELCDAEQLRIDMIDGKRDSSIDFSTLAQKKRGEKIYFSMVDQIQVYLESGSYPAEEKELFYKTLVQVLQGMKPANLRYLAYFEQYFSMVRSLSQRAGDQKDLEMLKNHVPMALDCIPYFVLRPCAKDVMLFAAGKKPYDVLTKYLDYNRAPWFLEILETVARNDPNAVKQFFGTNHAVNTVLKTSKDPVVLKLYDIFYEYGRASSGYTNIDLVFQGKLTIEQSEKMVADPNAWFLQLCSLRQSPDILGTYSVDQELAHHSLKVVRKVNLLHDESDAVRFAALNKSSDLELYNLIVYSRDEIFTSSFLGMFRRMMQRRTDSSLFVFFEKQQFNKFRTFIQMCAGFNTLQEVLNTMSAAEKDKLIDQMVRDLEKTGGNLEPAVEVADIYGSITDSTLREGLRNRLSDELIRCFLNRNLYGARLYGLLFKLAGGDPQALIGDAIHFDIPLLDKVEAGLMFPDGKNIQQHIFYDDDDGEAAFKSFIATFRSDAAYKISDAPAYVKIESIRGNKIILYCNKPAVEGGLESLRKVFESNGRYPDIVVHRGHSYHLGTTIEQLTNNAKVAVLGSCGGYLNITRVLDNASDAQIVSSKQVGTWTVNNVLLKDMTDMMRNGTGEIDWARLWQELDKKLRTNDKWKDYIPPYQNLGVRFVKAFESVQ